VGKKLWHESAPVRHFDSLSYDLPYEVMAAVDAQGVPLAYFKGERGTVSIPEEFYPWAQQNDVRVAGLTHNHPNRFGNLSPQDISVLPKTVPSAEIRAIGSLDGRTINSHIAYPSMDGSEIAGKLETGYKTVNDAFEAEYDEKLQDYLYQGLSPQEAKRMVLEKHLQGMLERRLQGQRSASRDAFDSTIKEVLEDFPEAYDGIRTPSQSFVDYPVAQSPRLTLEEREQMLNDIPWWGSEQSPRLQDKQSFRFRGR
jgi:hypothetical protein